jgi:hypothetical protein
MGILRLALRILLPRLSILHRRLRSMERQCVGIVWVYGQYGPLGVDAGSECFYTWDMVDGSDSSAAGTDSARLQTAAQPTVTPSPPTALKVDDNSVSGTSHGGCGRAFRMFGEQ